MNDVESMLGGGKPLDGHEVEEFIDSEMCESYGWTWAELQETPMYVRRAFFAILMAKRKAEADASKKAG